MPRYIDADNLTKRFYYLVDALSIESVHIDSIVQYIENMPTVGTVEVVRCEQCLHCEHRNNSEPYCHHHAMVVTPDYFCADGEEGEWIP